MQGGTTLGKAFETQEVGCEKDMDRCRTIYLGMLAVPFLGWSASMTYGGRTHFFGLFELPVLLPKNIEWANILQPAHIWAAWTLLALVGLHVVAALWHHFIKKDATLVQMLPRVTRGADALHARVD